MITINFNGTITLEGDLSKLDIEALKEYLEEAVCLDLDTEEHGSFSDDVEVVGIDLDWDSLALSLLKIKGSFLD